MLACVLLFGVPSCGLPRDVEGTLDRIRGGTLRVGVIDDEPWATTGRRRRGVEVSLVQALGRHLEAEIEWAAGSEQEILGALEVRSLDLAIGGLEADNPWASKVTFTLPYATTTTLIAAPRGTELPEDIAGHRVSVERETEAEALLEKTDARPVPVDDVTQVNGLVVTEDFLIDDLSLVDTGVHLSAAEHVFAVAHGENAWLNEVENFLLDERPRARTLIGSVEP